MAYIARYIPKGKATRIIPKEIVTSSFPTKRECLEALDLALQQVGLSLDSPEGEVKVEFCDVPFILVAARDWDGKLSRVYGLTLREYNQIVSESGLAGLSHFYRTMIDPRVPLQEKIKTYEKVFIGKSKKTRERRDITFNLGEMLSQSVDK